VALLHWEPARRTHVRGGVAARRTVHHGEETRGWLTGLKKQGGVWRKKGLWISRTRRRKKGVISIRRKLGRTRQERGYGVGDDPHKRKCGASGQKQRRSKRYESADAIHMAGKNPP